MNTNLVLWQLVFVSLAGLGCRHTASSSTPKIVGGALVETSDDKRTLLSTAIASPEKIKVSEKLILAGYGDLKNGDISFNKLYQLRTAVEKIDIPPNFKNNDYLRDKTLEDLNFTDEIKPAYIKLINQTIHAPDSYYGYGHDSTFNISPSQKKMFLLYRS